MTWDSSSVLHAIVGGALIGASAALLFAANGRIAGISGVASGLVVPAKGDVAWRALFLVGMLAGGLAGAALVPGAFDASGAPGIPMLAVSGLLVGLGARLGSGCTSGHGVCGLSRLSLRSLAATATFVGTGMLTVLVLRLGGHR
jgi:uncharacterized membrane protein YedE/YeeE